MVRHGSRPGRPAARQAATVCQSDKFNRRDHRGGVANSVGWRTAEVTLGWARRDPWALWRRGLGEGLPGSGKVSGKAWRRSGNHPVIQVWGTGEWLK